jgi:transposase-like protein
VLDVLVQQQRGQVAPRRFFRKSMKKTKSVRVLVTTNLRS